jgi:hypothetical protein
LGPLPNCNLSSSKKKEEFDGKVINESVEKIRNKNKLKLI